MRTIIIFIIAAVVGYYIVDYAGNYFGWWGDEQTNMKTAGVYLPDHNITIRFNAFQTAHHA